MKNQPQIEEILNNEERCEAVNECKTFEELAEVILSFADTDGNIQDKTRLFNAKEMAEHCINFSMIYPNTLTRMWGIRRQAMYMSYSNRR